jgi:hypothetical protein
MIESKYLTCAESAKEIRKALKFHFPGVKFSVRSSEYSMGASVSVRWTDGPTVDAVERVTQRFEGKSFNGSDDSTIYLRSTEVDENGKVLEVSHGSDYVDCHRSFSTAFYTDVARIVCAVYDVEMPEIVPAEKHGSAYAKHDGPRVGDHRTELRQMIRQIAHMIAA